MFFYSFGDRHDNFREDFQLLDEKGMSQKAFSERTGIAQSSISDWKRKKTNPVAEKIMIICEQLDVTPYELLSGTDGEDVIHHFLRFQFISISDKIKEGTGSVILTHSPTD